MAKAAAINIAGIKEIRRALKAMPEAIAEMKDLHHRVGVLVLNAAQARMPNGPLQASYRAGNIAGGAKVYSTMSGQNDYSGVQEFGGSVWWRPKGQYARVPIGGEFRMMGPHSIPVKPPLGRTGQQSYYVYPAIKQKHAQIVRMYEDEIPKIAKKYGLEGK